MLGRSQTVVRPAPTPTVELTDATALAMGNVAGCGIVSDQLRCWGWGGEQNALGITTLGAFSTPLTVPGVVPSQVEIADVAACAIIGGQAHCWGQDFSSRFGGVGRVFVPTLLPIAGTEDEVAIATHHACVRQGGTVQCSGLNTSGQLGRGAAPGDTTSFAPVSGLSDADTIQLGLNFSCARRADRSLVCWGAGTNGQLGDGGMANQNTPVAVTGLSRVLDFDLGERHACAIEAAADGDTAGRVFCWGINGFGAVGAGAADPQRTPFATSVMDAIAVAVGRNHSCAIRQDNRVVCWGLNSVYQLGDGTTATSFTPVDVGIMADIATPTIGASSSGNATCALQATGVPVCWGECYGGACATGVALSTGIPAPVAGL